MTRVLFVNGGIVALSSFAFGARAHHPLAPGVSRRSLPPTSRQVRGLVGAMHALLASAEFRDRLGSRARQLIETAASPDAYMERLTAIVKEAAESRTL
jgi:hypothetical protein